MDYSVGLMKKTGIGSKLSRARITYCL